MLFSVVCPTCEAKIGVHDKRLINQLVQCPKCGSIVQLTPPEGYSNSETSPQKTEEKPEKPAQTPAQPSAEPISEKKDKNAHPVHSPSSVPVSPPIPVPPPASIPVPPPVAIPGSIASEPLMPEPMSPGGFNVKPSAGGKSFSQRVGSFSEKLPSWAPYLVIGIGVMALIAILALFFFSSSRKDENNNNQPAAEDNVSTQNFEDQDYENPATEPLHHTEDRNSINDSAESNNENMIDSEKIHDENEKTEDNQPPADSSDNNEEINQNIEPAENADNAADPNKDAEESLPEDDADENPFEEVDESAADTPVENNNHNALSDEDNIAQEILNNNDNNDSNSGVNPDKDSVSDSEPSSIPGLDVKLTSITIRELKLSQCLQTIRELGDLPVEVNWDSLRRNGISADDKISWTGKDVTLQTALSEVLAQRGLMFKINEEGKIVFVPRVSVNAHSDSSVNSSQQGGSAMVKTPYSVSDLVGHSPEQTVKLVKSIREFLCPGDWKEVGGKGTIVSSGGGSIVITQSPQNQWIIADFLDRLRLARRLAPLYNRDASLEPMSVRAQSALKRNVGINFQPTADLKTAMSEIGQRIGVNILLDESSLRVAGISPQFPISFDARAMSLEETFNRIHEETGLTYLAQTPNSFILTTAQGAKSMMTVEFYPIADLVSFGLTPAVLMEQIVKFEPKSWKSQDSASFGLIDFDANSDCLIVRQSPTVLSKITGLLTQLRARLKEKQ